MSRANRREGEPSILCKPDACENAVPTLLWIYQEMNILKEGKNDREEGRMEMSEIKAADAEVVAAKAGADQFQGTTRELTQGCK